MISVVINAKNEENMIKTCLESVKWADEIVVVLNDSTDKTKDIVKLYTNKIFEIAGQGFSKVKNKGLEETEGDWVLFIDADERVLQPLKEELQEIVKNDDRSAYALSRKNIIFGEEVHYGPYKHDWIIRFVKKDKCRGWVGDVHEHLDFDGELGYTKKSLLHLTHRNIDQVILKSLEWSKIDAKLRLDSKHPSMSKWRFLRILISEFYNQLIKRRGVFGGTVGVIDSVLQVFFFYMTYIRLWEMQKKENLDLTYEEIDKNLLKNNFRY